MDFDDLDTYNGNAEHDMWVDFDDLDTYNGNAEHEMWVDFDNYENTGNPDVFDEPDLGNFINNLND